MTRTRDPQQKIAVIKQAAAELIIEEGPDALTHRAVAARAGVALGTTTKYFATIDDLRKSALAYLSAEVDNDIEDLRRQLASDGDPVGVIVGELIEFLSDERAVQRECCLLYAGVFDQDLRDIAVAWTNGVHAAGSKYFSDAAMAAIAMYVDGLVVNVALTGNPPAELQLRAIIGALAAI